MPTSAGIHAPSPAKESVASLQSRKTAWEQLAAAHPRRAQVRPMERGSGIDLHPRHESRFATAVNTREATRGLVKRTRAPNLSTAKRKPSSSGRARNLTQ